MKAPFLNALCDAINGGVCPDCRAPAAALMEGPRGGMNVNVCCPSCWSAFNVAYWRGTCVSAERIPNDFWRGTPGFTAHGRA